MSNSRYTRVLATALAILTLSSLSALAQTKTYLILSNGQGKGSTAFAARVASAGGNMISNMESIGVVTATSSNPAFVANMSATAGVQNVAEDPQIQWLPNEFAIEASDPVAGSLGALVEPRADLQWNMVQIHADQTAANGDIGNGVARARVAIVDSGIV